jgi:NAD(P)-dependent dehydrogenase (short-subunit alcohol dehydrogenase family)
MSLFDSFRYDGKRVLVVGGATGMGAAAAELVQDAGAEVTWRWSTAAAISGLTLVSDVGYLTSGLTESFPAAAPIAHLLYAR